MLFKILSEASIFPWPAKRGTPLLDDHLRHRAVVTDTIEPGERGRVAFQGTTWFAFCRYQVVILPGMPVCVVEHYNATTLIVEPMQLVRAQPLHADPVVLGF
ncbi:MAG TPA: NfeD family protein [Nodosilinea sp.]|nr:NfeD family protein [Nodosilinea sp.]